MLGGLVITTVATANAEVVKLQADLKGSNEVPPNNSSGSGKAEATYDTETKTLTYTVTYAGLTGPRLGHISTAPVKPARTPASRCHSRPSKARSRAPRRSLKIRQRICWPESGTRTSTPP